jgi:glycosyltransferase involved in cell wall biosynthesis
MADFLAIPRSKIYVVPLGINLKGYDDERKNDPERFTVGYFARIAPEKGLHILADAYRELRARGELAGAKMEVAGYLAPEHHGYLDQIKSEMKDAGLGDEFQYHGELDRDSKIDFFKRMDLFSMPTTYAEPKGLSVIEAMASGTPVVQPKWGAFPEMIERTRGGILVEPNDSASLAEGILSLWKNQEYARDLGRQGAQGVRQHYHVARMAELALEVYADLQRKDQERRRKARK